MSTTTPATTTYGSVPSGDDAPTEFRKTRRCNDVLFGLLFWAHLGAVGYYWWTASSDGALPDITADKGVLKFTGAVAGGALALASGSLFFMAVFADELVQVALTVSVLLTAAVAAYGVYAGVVWMMVVGGVAVLAALGFTCYVWKKIPFAAANLKTAITAIRTNFGLILFAYLLEVVAFAFVVVWIDAAGTQLQVDAWWMVLLYAISFFWTQQVINNLQHVIVSSVLGTWWYNPNDANSCWDDGLNRAICHAITYSFGSICFGSLLAGTVQALKWVHRITAHYAEQNSCLRCITACIDCLLSCIQNALEYFNKWAYTFVGIHGDSYVTAGKSVVALFKQRGWSSLVNDYLADAVMVTMKLSVSLLSALMGWWLVNHDNDIFEGVGVDSSSDDIYGFVCGALIGWIISSIMMELVGSAVCAVIVCFAEAPAVFQQKHAELCKEMLQAWTQAYPDECADDFSTVKPF